MSTQAAYLPNSEIEIICPEIQRGRIRYALFDFDGTLSLIREGWQGIMIPMMVEILLSTPYHEDPARIEQVVMDFVTRMTGKQTIYQMIQLCDEVAARGGMPLAPLEYKHIYNERLNQHIRERIAALKSRRAQPEEMTVPGAFDLLERLKSHRVECYLASGTDEKYVIEEAELLGLRPYFTEIYGAQENYQNYSKKMVIERILQAHQLHGSEFVAFGDGYVEIEDSKSVGGIAVGVASDEKNRRGVDAWKRTRLISAGADLIVPDFRQAGLLESYLFQS